MIFFSASALATGLFTISLVFDLISLIDSTMIAWGLDPTPLPGLARYSAASWFCLLLGLSTSLFALLGDAMKTSSASTLGWTAMLFYLFSLEGRFGENTTVASMLSPSVVLLSLIGLGLQIRSMNLLFGSLIADEKSRIEGSDEASEISTTRHGKKAA